MKKLKVLSILILITCFTNTIAQVQIGASIVGDSISQDLGFSVSMPDHRTIAIASIGFNRGRGLIQIYQLKRSGWVQKGNDIAGHPNTSTLSGYSLSMPDTNTIAVGIPNYLSVGLVKIYKWDGTAWVQKGITQDYTTMHGRAGASVSMPDTNTFAVGAPSSDHTVLGSTRVYKWNTVSWEKKGNDIIGEYPERQSGTSTCMPDANTIGIGAIQGKGSARVFTWNGTSWAQKGLKILGEAYYDEFGSSIAMPDINTIAVGAPLNDANGINAGHVRIYAWNGLAWIQKGLDIKGSTNSDKLGTSVTMPDPNTVAVGANQRNQNSPGYVRLYKWDGTAWIQSGVDINGEINYGGFGNSISMPDVNNIAIGAPYDSTNGLHSGKMRAFSFCNTLDTVSIRTCNKFTSPSGLYTWNNSGSYLDTIPNSKGCDSMIRFEVFLRKVNDGINNFGTSLAASSFTGSYQWVDCNNNLTVIPGANTQYFTPTIPGYYAVQVTDLGCTVMSNCEYVNTVGLDENSLSAIKFSPNPTNGIINLDFGSNNLNITVKVNSINGKLIEEHLNVNTNSTRIDLSNNPAGVYVVTVQNKDFIKVLKVVRN
jgi:hypothetical protein